MPYDNSYYGSGGAPDYYAPLPFDPNQGLTQTGGTPSSTTTKKKHKKGGSGKSTDNVSSSSPPIPTTTTSTGVTIADYPQTVYPIPLVIKQPVSVKQTPVGTGGKTTLRPGI